MQNRVGLVCLFFLVTGSASSSAQPAPPPPPPPPAVIAPTALEQMRVAGQREILPDPLTQRDIIDSGKTKLVSTYKLCIDATGAVGNVNMLKSTGFPAYDAKLSATMRGTWRYSPYLKDGVATSVCTSVTFIVTADKFPPLPRNLPPRAAAPAPVESPDLRPIQLRPALPPVPVSLVKANSARHSMAVRLGAGELAALSGAPIRIADLEPRWASVRASARTLAGTKPQTLVFDTPGPYSLVLRVNPSQLLSVLRVPVLLAASPKEIGGSLASNTPGLRIDRGLPIKILERRGSAAKIELSYEQLVPLVGWVPADAIGLSFELRDEEDAKALLRFTRGRSVLVSPQTPLLRSPGGSGKVATLSSLLRRDRQLEVTEVARKAGSVLIFSQHRGWSAMGWIGADAVTPVVVEESEWDADALEGDGEGWSEAMEGESGDGGSYPSSSTGVELVKGTELLSSLDGEPIGWVTSTHRVFPAETNRKGYRVRLDLPYGELDVWIDRNPIVQPERMNR